MVDSKVTSLRKKFNEKDLLSYSAFSTLSDTLLVPQ